MNILTCYHCLSRLTWLKWPSLISGALLIHFLLSAGIWTIWLAGILRNPNMRDGFQTSLVQSGPAFLLCGLAAAVFIFALRLRKIARRGAIVLLSASIVFFWLDVHFQRYQISVDIATKEYWDGGGKEHHYFTWWWYNDRWLR